MTKKEATRLIDELWTWVETVFPVFGTTLYDVWLDNDWTLSRGHRGSKLIGEDMVRLKEILTNPEHPDRLPIAMDAYFFDNGDEGERRDRFNPKTENERYFKRYLHNLLGYKYEVGDYD